MSFELLLIISVIAISINVPSVCLTCVAFNSGMARLGVLKQALPYTSYIVLCLIAVGSIMYLSGVDNPLRYIGLAVVPLPILVTASLVKLFMPAHAAH